MADWVVPDSRAHGDSFVVAGAGAADASSTPSRRAKLLICGAVLLVLLGWLHLFPYTADGDSALHYLNARETALEPWRGLHAWARPGFKLLITLPATFGHAAARTAVAIVSVILVWQTIGLATDLKIRNALLAGPLLIWQPFVFALAADTMTEMPMALGTVLAVRLWIRGSPLASCLIVGFLPTIRPEGFFYGLLWGCMVLASQWGASRTAAWRPRQAVAGVLARCGMLSVGLASWAFACMIFKGDWLYVLTDWSWPAASFANHPRGSLFHHIVWWPLYCGAPLFILFAAGVIVLVRRPALARAMWLPLSVWAIVFVVHSVLFWRGWFVSYGLLRIFGCTAPFTALICLHGWNSILDLCRRSPGGWRSQRVATGVLAVTATAWMLLQYVADPAHRECFSLQRCADFVRAQHLLDGGAHFVAGNRIATAQLGLNTLSPQVHELPCDHAYVARVLDELPLGSIAVWDNRQAAVWHGHRIEDLVGAGFNVLYETTHWDPFDAIGGRPPWWWGEMRYVVARKERTAIGVAASEWPGW